MSFEVDRPIRLLADPSELLKDGLNHHALTNPTSNNNRTNSSCVSDLPHHHVKQQQQPSTGSNSSTAGVSSPTYSIASSSLSSNSAASSTIYSNNSATTHDGAYDGGSDSSNSSTKHINGVSNKSASNLYMYHPPPDVSPRQRGMNYNSKWMGGVGYDNKHLLSPVPDCLDHDPTAAAAVAACSSGVNEHTPTRVPLPTPPASGGTPPQQTWRDMDRRYDFAPRSSMSHPYWAPSTTTTTSSMCMPPTAAAPPLYHELLPHHQQQQHPSYWMGLHHQQQHHPIPSPSSSSLLENRRSPYPSSYHHPYPTTTMTQSKKSLHADPGTANNKVVSSTATPRRYKCTVCVKRFTRPSSLATHMHSHTGEKPYQCQVEGCGRRFSVVSNLRRHAKIHNNQPKSS
ncbi:hypothetical protein RO3G_06264 [Lichtheimia corymbifera JMRC:FSU:9682]|uniref:C2H2-type domain-containing protein n=1 Tax=Lichtheimia corymbifera JMRC:FSU:9682 TaxID=1263082 RepID=A0A068RWQ2_9FUNG|nr:hypothetical protein RO3G_06264 [Lichtheimia corymbifera JMRC:FSU:9682]